MGQKLFVRIKDRMHRVKGREPQEGDKFSFRMARFIIHKKGWIESVFVAGCFLPDSDAFCKCEL